MKGFQTYLFTEKMEEELYQEQRAIFEKVNLSREDFITAMSQLYDMGDQEAINRAATMMADIGVEREVERIFSEKAPKAASVSKDRLAIAIKKLKIDADDKVKLANGIYTGDAFDFSKVLNTSGKVVSMRSIVNSSYPGAADLLPQLVSWDDSPDSSKRGKGKTELFMIIAGKNGRTPTKGDALVDGVAVEIKSYKGSLSYEYTVSGKQNNGVPLRDAWIDEAKALYRKRGLMKKWYKGTPFGLGGGTGKNFKSMHQVMSAFCMELQNHEKNPMPWNQINAWIVKTTHKVMGVSGTKYSTMVWDSDGKLDVHNFLRMWASCGLDYYKQEEGFDKLIMINWKSLDCIVVNSGKDMMKLGNRLNPLAISNNGMPGQNGSVSAGSVK